MYNPNADYVVETPTNPAAAPARAAADYTGFKVKNTKIPADISMAVSTDNAISGVENVAADVVDDAEVEYYTIAGVRVIGEPAPGLYIRRQGNKVTKVVIR